MDAVLDAITDVNNDDEQEESNHEADIVGGEQELEDSFENASDMTDTKKPVVYDSIKVIDEITLKEMTCPL